MKLKILGSGGWAGIPVAFCRCRVCKDAYSNPLGKNNRNRPQLLIESSKGKFLIEISPDIRLQSARFNLPDDIQNFLVTHKHFDHLDGLTQLNSWIKYYLHKKPKIYCNKETKEFIDQVYFEIPTNVKVIEPFKKFTLEGIKVTPIPLRHVSEEDQDRRTTSLNEFGYVLEEDGKRIIYLGDYYQSPEKSYKEIVGADVAIIDGTYLFQDKFPNNPETKGLANDPDHLHGQEVLDFASSLAAKKTIFTNTTHLSQMTHQELEKLLPKNCALAYDGLEIKL